MKAHLKMDLRNELTFPKNSNLELSEAVPFSIPALLEIPQAGSLCINTDEEGHQAGIEFLQSTVMRLLMTIPPGKARFTFFDPLALGETFAGFMHLNDYKEELTGGRVFTSSRQMEQRLAEVNEHMETVIQKYLRSEFDNICDYNEEVGEIAEPFRFIAISDFPVNFSEDAVQRLISIAKSGPRCGVFIILHRDKRLPIPGHFDISELEDHCLTVEHKSGEFNWLKSGFKHTALSMEKLPSTTAMNEIIKEVGDASVNATIVEIPFQKVETKEKWSASSAEDLKVAIGLSGTRQQMLTFGHGTSQHALIAGKTGSGKSNLIHVIICNMARKYSPDELEFYLIDFKKGVEFKAYSSAQLPHAKAIAIESDREFGLSVLRKIDNDLNDRGELLRKAESQNITQYRKTTGKKMARMMLVIDEFQEIFTEDDMVAQEASLLLDRIVRQGRAFGVHVLLGSQTLAGTYTIARSTMGQMAIRIALQCSESDSYVILNENNPAARLLSRPGEAIYNHQAGLPEYNTPFQTAYLPEEDKNTALDDLNGDFSDCFVFEGNIPANLARCPTMDKFIADSEKQGTKRIFIGEPNAIRPAESISFSAMAGQNLMVIGQKEESALAMTTSAISSLALSHEKDQAQFIVLDGSSADRPRKEYFESLADVIPHELKIVSPNTVVTALEELYAELQKRINGESSDQRIFISIHALQRFRKLKQEEGFSWDDDSKGPDAQLAEILSAGPEYHIHTMLWCDSWNSLNRLIARKTLTEFEYRILFQMGQSDSINLIDTPAASKLSLHTALIFNDQTGDALKFRPFSLPGKEWLEKLKISFAVEV